MKNRVTSPVSLLIITGFLLHLIVYMLLPVTDTFGRYSNSSPLYFSALTEHFGDYLSFTTNIPPGTFLVHALVLAVMGVKTAINIRAFFILVSILDMIAVVALYKAARKLGSGQKISLLTMLLFSVAIIPFELWRDGMHYDHLTLSFTCFFVWALVKIIKENNSLANKLLVSITAGLLVSQSAASSAIVPFSVLVILAFLYIPKKQFGQLGYTILICLSLPIIVLIAISKKNASEGQDGLTSNKAGPAMMMVVQRAYQYDVAAIRQFASENGAPDWYLWTYDHATPPVDSVTGKQAGQWINLAQAFGICFYSADGKANHNPWQFDFDPLDNYLKKNGPAKLLPIVKADAEDAVYKPYRYAGFSPELSPRWIGVYGSISKKIFFSALKKNPSGMAGAFIQQQGIFALYGPLFLYNTTQSKPSLIARSGLKTLPEKLPLHGLFISAAILFALVSFTTYVLVLFNIPLVIWRFFQNIRSGKTQPVVNHFFLLSIPVLCIAVVYSCLVGGENDRYFVQAAPYLLVLTTCLPVYFNLKPKNNYLKK